LLQVDFVNDRVIRYKEPVCLENGYVIDNYENIMANKLSAVIGRDSAKDIFDIYLLDKYYDFDYKEILRVTHQKAGFSDDDLIIRLKTFPLSLMKNISLVEWICHFWMDLRKRLHRLSRRLSVQYNEPKE